MTPTTTPSGATTSRLSKGAPVTPRNARAINVRITMLNGRSQSIGADARGLEPARGRGRLLLRCVREAKTGRRRVFFERRRDRQGVRMGPEARAWPRCRARDRMRTVPPDEAAVTALHRDSRGGCVG